MNATARMACWIPSLVLTASCELQAAESPSGAASPIAIAQHATLPRRPGFEPNRGQWRAPVRFAAHDGAAKVFLTSAEAVWRLGAPR